MLASGSFDVVLEPQEDKDAPAGRMLISKEYHGDMQGKGVGQMLSCRTERGDSVYSAIEEFSGTVNGKKGKMTLFHTGKMSEGEQSLSITIVGGSGQGELVSIEGSLFIIQEDDLHQYTVEYYL